MTTIHMETEKVHAVAKKLDTDGVLMLSNLNQTRSSASRLRFAWQGGDADNFNGELNRLIKNIENQVVALQNLSTHVSREVDEWIGVDSANQFQTGRELVTKTGLTDLRKGAEFFDLAFKATLGMGIVVGTESEIVVYGGRTLKELAGVSTHLTHIKATNLPGHMLNQGAFGPLAVGIGALEFVDRGIQNWANYEKPSERGVASTLDLLFIAGKTVATHYAGYGVAMLATGLLTTVGAPAVAVGAVGLLAWWGGSYIAGQLADGAYDRVKDGAVHAIAPAVDSMVSNAHQFFSDPVRSIDHLFQNSIDKIALPFHSGSN